MCPKCPSVKQYLENIMPQKKDLTGEFINAATKEGLDEARKYKAMNVPTVIFLDGEAEKGRTGKIEEIDEFLQAVE